MRLSLAVPYVKPLLLVSAMCDSVAVAEAMSPERVLGLSAVLLLLSLVVLMLRLLPHIFQAHRSQGARALRPQEGDLERLARWLRGIEEIAGELPDHLAIEDSVRCRAVRRKAHEPGDLGGRGFSADEQQQTGDEDASANRA